MPTTDFDDLLNDPSIASTPTLDQGARWIGSSITASEIAALLAPSLYAQLENGEEASVVRAAERATMHVATILGRLCAITNLNHPATRQIVMFWTIYELFLGLGNPASGAEYKRKAKDLIIAAFGSYPDADGVQEGKPAIGAVTAPRPRVWP